MSPRLYFTSDELTARATVVQCDPEAEGRYQVTLSHTLFHPQGGGQPADSGWIGDARVLHVEQVGSDIVHLTDRPVALGETLIKVDAAPRQLHARLHSAGHVISCVGAEYGWRAIKGHHWPGESRVVFQVDPAMSLPLPEQFEQQLNALLASDLPRITQIEGAVRQIGFGHLPASPCGGTHVASLATIGTVRISRIKQKKGELSVHYALIETTPA